MVGMGFGVMLRMACECSLNPYFLGSLFNGLCSSENECLANCNMHF